MRPLIEILEDERSIMQKQEMIYRLIEKGVDEDTFETLSIRIRRASHELDIVRGEMKAYFKELLG